MKIEQLANKNQFVIYDDNKIVFQSYNSVVAIIEGDQLMLGCDWDYSHTTLKHLYIFMDQYLNGLYNIFKNSNNKRKSIQRLIDKGIIKYDSNLC